MYAGLDIGATHIRAALADDDGLVETYTAQTPEGDGDEVTRAALDALGRVCGDNDVEAAGIGTVGRLHDGDVVGPANLPSERIALVEPVGEFLGTSDVVAVNDTTAAVIAESDARDASDIVYLSVSTGIGAGVVVDGNVLRGRAGNAGEVGHMTLDPEGRLECGCGALGHWEAYCSGANLPEYARYLHDEHDVGTRISLGDTTAEELLGSDDPLAALVAERSADWNVQGVANLVQAYAPDVVAFGGAVALNNTGKVVEPVRERLGEHVFGTVPDLDLSLLGDDAVLVGAVTAARKHV